MTGCTLERVGIDQLMTGELTGELAAELEEHLASDCDTCARVLDEAGLDEETLSMMVLAAQQPQADAARLDQIWQRVEAELPAASDSEAPNVIPMRPSRRRFFSVASVAGIAAAAALILVVLPGDPDETTGIKGSADGAIGTLVLEPKGSFKDGDTVRLTYQLDRDAYVTVMHARYLSGPSTTLFNDRLAAAPGGGGRFPVGGGHLGYAFENEPGQHQFALLVSDRLLDEERRRVIFSAITSQPDEARHDFKMEGRGVHVHAIMVEVERAP